jgi:signal recognition particle GTPase
MAAAKAVFVVAIQDELEIPTRFVGTGEKLDDLRRSSGKPTSRICCEARAARL